jgi:hypothetical protein
LKEKERKKKEGERGRANARAREKNEAGGGKTGKASEPGRWARLRAVEKGGRERRKRKIFGGAKRSGAFSRKKGRGAPADEGAPD